MSRSTMLRLDVTFRLEACSPDMKVIV